MHAHRISKSMCTKRMLDWHSLNLCRRYLQSPGRNNIVKHLKNICGDHSATLRSAQYDASRTGQYEEFNQVKVQAKTSLDALNKLRRWLLAFQVVVSSGCQGQKRKPFEFSDVQHVQASGREIATIRRACMEEAYFVEPSLAHHRV